MVNFTTRTVNIQAHKFLYKQVTIYFFHNILVLISLICLSAGFYSKSEDALV